MTLLLCVLLVVIQGPTAAGRSLAGEATVTAGVRWHRPEQGGKAKGPREHRKGGICQRRQLIGGGGGGKDKEPEGASWVTTCIRGPLAGVCAPGGFYLFESVGEGAGGGPHRQTHRSYLFGRRAETGSLSPQPVASPGNNGALCPPPGALSPCTRASRGLQRHVTPERGRRGPGLGPDPTLLRAIPFSGVNLYPPDLRVPRAPSRGVGSTPRFFV